MKIKLYKLTDQKMQTRNGFQWKLGEWVEAKPKNSNYDKPLCSDAWLHCYESPLLAILHNPIHADIKSPRLFEVEVCGKSKFNSQLKCGFRKMRLIKEIPLPEITLMQRITYGVLCAKQVYKNEQWNNWADNWLNNIDRTKNTADAAAHATAARATAVYAAAHAAHAAAYAAHATAVYAAYAATAAYAAHAAATYAAHAAAYAATAAATSVDLDLIDIVNKAMEYEG